MTSTRLDDDSKPFHEEFGPVDDHIEESPVGFGKIEEADAFARRCAIVDALADELADAGLDIRGRGASEFSMVQAMGMNALMPEYTGSFLMNKDTRVAYNADNELVVEDPPDIALQQAVVRYFRDHPETHAELAECIALTCRVADPFSPIEAPAVSVVFFGQSQSSGDFVVGGKRVGQINDQTGTIYIPGCGISGLLDCSRFLQKLGDKRCPNLNFVLSDSHPFVAEIGTRFARYLGDPRIEFIPDSMKNIVIPDTTTHVVLSFVEAAGAPALQAVADQVAALKDVRIYAVSGASANEYSGLTSDAVARIFEDSGVPFHYRQRVPSYSTHFVSDGKSVDFCDLTEAQALALIKAELPHGSRPNTTAEILTTTFTRRPD